MHCYHLDVVCPNCHEALNDKDHFIKNAPAIRFLAENKGKKGFLWISSIYGDHETMEPDELDVLPGDIVRFFCPFCEKELPIVEKCSCKANQLRLELTTGGNLQFCNRKGCYYGNLRFINPDELDKFLGIK